jgi:hypothetical protein
MMISACSSTAQTIMVQLDVLSKIGMAAMQIQNMEVCNQVMARTTALKTFREKLDAFARELNQISQSK